jgi:hypothetical protein
MALSRRRPAVQAAVAAMVLIGALSGPSPEARPLFRPRPGPIDHPLAIASADFDRDGHDDLLIAEYQAAILELLVGRGDGTFAPIASGPFGVGTATQFTPTTGPFGLVVTDLNPQDVDADTIPNASDNCPNVPNGPGGTATSQADANANGIGDACETPLADIDHDGQVDDKVDTDGDTIPDYDPGDGTPGSARLDNCPRLPNQDQKDTETAKGIDDLCGTPDDNPLLYGTDGQCGTPDDRIGTAKGIDGLCGTPDDNPLLFGTDGQCGTPDDRIGDGVGDACATSPDILILTTSAGSGSSLGSVRVRLNDGSGGMVGRSSYVTGVAPTQVIVADVSGDRIPDLLVANSSIDLVQYLPGIGDGQFGGAPVMSTGDGPQALVAADIDGDLDLDLIVANGIAGSLSVYRNASGTLPTSTLEAYPTGGSHPTVLLAGRLNADAFDDLVVLSQGSLACSGGPRDTLPCSANSECADLVEPAKSGTCAGGDGAVQVFTGATAGSTPGLAAGPVVPLTSGPGPHRPRAGTLRDVDGNGTLDLVIADFTGSAVWILPGNGDATFGSPVIVPVGGNPADLAFLTLDPPTSLDLAVLDTTGNRVDLLEHGAGTSYAPAATSPASPWRDTSSMALIGADSNVGFDVVLLQRQNARVDVLSGIGDGSFRATPVVDPSGAAAGSGFVVADVRQDGRPDLAILDSAARTLTVLTGEPNGQFLERSTVPSPANAVRVDATSLYESVSDYDRDGVPNVVDDCPGVYNPPNCKVIDAACKLDSIACTDVALAPTDCAKTDPVTHQCDSDANGIGDHCQVLGVDTSTPPVCVALDSDFDLKADYDQTALKKTSTGALDFDGDGDENTQDNCPTIANPDQEDTETASGPDGICGTGDDFASLVGPDGLCGTADDVVGDRVGDACEVLRDTDQDGVADDPIDSDGDTILDFDPLTRRIDNCPLIANEGQEDNDQDGVGNACVIAAALDKCVSTRNPGQEDRDGDGIGDVCAGPAQDLFLLDAAAGRVDVLQGDNTGRLRTSDVSPLTGLSGPTAVRSGHFTLDCLANGALCNDRGDSTSEVNPPIFDLAVLQAGAFGNLGDDGLTIFSGSAAGTFTPLPAVALGGDPTLLLRAVDQKLCASPRDPANPSLRFDSDNLSDLLVALSPGNSTLSVLVPSNQNEVNASLSPLVRPVAFDAAIPLPPDAVDVVLADVNQDRRDDLVLLSSAGGVATITPYLGLGNGLFFTDPSLATTGLPFDATHLASANVDTKTESVFPDLVLFETRDQAPFSLLNVLQERADIDGSGRVDGGDLAFFAAAFGATRGEDFTLLPDATFARTGDGPADTLIRSNTLVPGQDLPDSSNFCNTVLDAGTGRYGIPVDINLDGIVDGVDLAFLAGRFGRALP